MKPLYYIVFCEGQQFKFKHRASMRAFKLACKLAGKSTIIKAVGF